MGGLVLGGCTNHCSPSGINHIKPKYGISWFSKTKLEAPGGATELCLRSVTRPLLRTLSQWTYEDGGEDDDVVLPDSASPQSVGDVVGLVNVLGEDGGCQAVLGVVGPGHHLLQCLELQHLHHRAKDLQRRNLA